MSFRVQHVPACWTRSKIWEKTAWRIRIGEYRVIYDVFDSELVVTVVRAGHRREVYDH